MKLFFIEQRLPHVLRLVRAIDAEQARELFAPHLIPGFADPDVEITELKPDGAPLLLWEFEWKDGLSS